MSICSLKHDENHDTCLAFKEDSTPRYTYNVTCHDINMTGSDESQLSVSYKLFHAGFSPETAEVGSPCFLFKVAAVANTTLSDVSAVCCLFI